MADVFQKKHFIVNVRKEVLKSVVLYFMSMFSFVFFKKRVISHNYHDALASSYNVTKATIRINQLSQAELVSPQDLFHLRKTAILIWQQHNYLLFSLYIKIRRNTSVKSCVSENEKLYLTHHLPLNAFTGKHQLKVKIAKCLKHEE